MAVPERVEIKLSIGAADVAPARERLGWTDHRAKPGDIWFCDRLSGRAGKRRLDLFDRDLIVRLRHWSHDVSDTTIKYRGSSPLTLPKKWAEPDKDRGYKIEGDWTGKSQKVSASMTSTVDGHDVEGSVARKPAAVKPLFSAEQRAFAAAVGNGGKVGWKSLQALGPIHALRWNEQMHDGLGIELGGEQWIAGDLLFLELSIRVKVDKAQEWQDRFTRWAEDEHLGVSAVATTKTEAVLHHFADRVQT